MPPRPLTLTHTFAALCVSAHESLGGSEVVSVRGEHGFHVAVRAPPSPPCVATVEAAAHVHKAIACPAPPLLPS